MQAYRSAIDGIDLFYAIRIEDGVAGANGINTQCGIFLDDFDDMDLSEIDVSACTPKKGKRTEKTPLLVLCAALLAIVAIMLPIGTYYSGIEKGYSEGYDRGRDAGYNSGTDAGYKKGYHSGYDDGRAAVDLDVAYEYGYNDGYVDGYSDAMQ